MELLYRSDIASPKVSLILLDWSCRESFHIFKYLHDQDVPRESYEVVWIEFYSRRSPEIRALLEEALAAGRPAPVDAWLALDFPDEVYYHKHLMYNVGLAMARGELACIMDSDAIVGPGFIRALTEAFERTPRMALHLDEVRNTHRRHYPFDYPSVTQVLGEGCINWNGATTTGLADQRTPILTRNYGACLCARRDDMLAVGGADEHLDYLGHVCGPYDITFRLANMGVPEVWHDSEFLYHCWHPGTDGGNNYIGPHDGRNNSLLALEALKSGRVYPLVENEAVKRLRLAGDAPIQEADLLALAVARDRQELWRIDDQKRLLSLGRQAYYASRFEEAARILLEELPELPGDAVIQAELGWALCALGRLDESERHLRASLAEDPAQPLAHKAMGWLMRHRGRPAQAVEHFDRALAGASGHLDDFHQECLRGRGWCHLETGRAQEAAGDFLRAMEHTPPAVWQVVSDLRFGLGLALERQGDVAGARRELTLAQNALEQAPQGSSMELALAVRKHLSDLGSRSGLGARAASLAWRLRSKLRALLGGTA